MDQKAFYHSPSLPSARDARRKRKLELAEQKVRTPFLSSEHSGRSNLNRIGTAYETFVFTLQSLAIEKASQSPNFGVFSFEISASGRRHFVIGHPMEIFHKIKRLKRHKRHWYEVIVQGTPCKLYFDIEFHLEHNRHRDGTQALSTFKSSLLLYLRHSLGLICTTAHILDLESSSDQKFSHHLIVNLPKDQMFANNMHVGSFVKTFMSNLSDGERSEFTFRDKHGEKTETFVDLSVYSKNRNFRTYLSSKFGREPCLQLSVESLAHAEVKSDKEVFLMSLASWTGHSNCDPIKIPGSAVGLSNVTKPGLQSRTNHASGPKSPFPEVDDFISGLAVPGCIRKVVWKETEMSLEYEILGFRFCQNVGRAHKSNNIRYIVLLKRGIYFQMCHDPECRDFKSNDLTLPFDTKSWVDLFEGEISCANGFGFNDQSDDDDQMLSNIYEETLASTILFSQETTGEKEDNK